MIKLALTNKVGKDALEHYGLGAGTGTSTSTMTDTARDDGRVEGGSGRGRGTTIETEAGDEGLHL